MLCVLCIMCNTGIYESVVCCFSLGFRIARAVKIVAYFRLIFHNKSFVDGNKCYVLTFWYRGTKGNGRKLYNDMHSHLQGVPLTTEPDISLTLRLLMSYIYIYIYIYIYMEHLFLMFLDHTQRRTTVGRTPLDE